MISLAMLVKDPPLDRLAALLDYVAPVVGQVVIVVDDRTSEADCEAMRALGAELVPFTWNDDFATARNAALPVCRGDWVLHLDPDELPSAAMLDFLAAVARTDWHDAFWQGVTYLAPRGYLFWTRTYYDGRLAEAHELDWHCRLFRREHGAWYKRIHEQVSIDGLPEGTARFARLDEPGLVKAPAGAYLIHSHLHVPGKSAEYARIEAVR